MGFFKRKPKVKPPMPDEQRAMLLVTKLLHGVCYVYWKRDARPYHAELSEAMGLYEKMYGDKPEHFREFYQDFDVRGFLADHATGFTENADV